MSMKIRYPLFIVIAILLGLVLFRFETKKSPHVVLVFPENSAEQVSEYSSVSATIINLTKGGIDEKTVTPETVFLTNQKTGEYIPADVKKTASNTISLSPKAPLKLNTTYLVNITSGVKDYSGNTVSPYTSCFTTGEVASDEMQQVKFEKLALPTATGQYTSLTVGPDGKLYALALDGLIKRFTIEADGSLGKPDSLFALQDAYGNRTQRLAIGLAFVPASKADSLVAYVTHCTYMLSEGPDWDGKLTRLTGKNLQQVQDLVINLPRSFKDHLTNSIAFGPDGALYFNQGSNTAMGRADKTWGLRNEHLLSATVLRLDLQKLRRFPLDAKTIDGGGTYNPYSANAPLTIYATGLRNAYDLVWHSNGELYVPTNGSAHGGNTPSSVAGYINPSGKMYTGRYVPELTEVHLAQRDFLFKIKKGGYYGHPNPIRGEYVMNGGNPTPYIDPGQVDEYPVGTWPDANWQGISYDFKDHKSPNGVIEYKSNAFDGALQGKLLVVRYSTSNDIMVLTPGGAEKDIVSAREGTEVEGLSGFIMPIDLTEDVRTGCIYVAELGSERITLLRPKTGLVHATKPAALLKAAKPSR